MEVAQELLIPGQELIVYGPEECVQYTAHWTGIPVWYIRDVKKHDCTFQEGITIWEPANNHGESLERMALRRVEMYGGKFVGENNQYLADKVKTKRILSCRSSDAHQIENVDIFVYSRRQEVSDFVDAAYDLFKDDISQETVLLRQLLERDLAS